MKRLPFSACLLVSIFCLISACSRELDPSKGSSQLNGLYAPSTVWTKSTLSVCWMTPGFAQEKIWVKEKIEQTWQKHANLRFIGWQTCPRDGTGADITIAIRDTEEGIYTLGLGSQLQYLTPGMVLNFTFANWSPSCAHTLRSCIETNAVHEFGHAIGLSHEHNRTDRHRDCTEDMQGGYSSDLRYGSFDRDSIMNYCYSSSYSNRLSSGDIHLVQYLYGKPQGQSKVATSPAPQEPASSQKLSFGPFGNNTTQQLASLATQFGASVSFTIEVDIEYHDKCAYDYLLVESPDGSAKVCGKSSYQAKDFRTPVTFTFYGDGDVPSKSVSISNISFMKKANGAASIKATSL